MTEQLRAAGLSPRFRILSETGHEYPTNFSAELRTTLEFVLAPAGSDGKARTPWGSRCPELVSSSGQAASNGQLAPFLHQ